MPDTTALTLAKAVVDEMLAQDTFSRWLGVQVIDVGPGRAKIQMTVRPEMMNGFGVCHGGIPFAFADSAFAFAANSHGRVSVAIENNISYPNPIASGDVLVAEAQELNLGNKLGIYQVTVTKHTGENVAIFRGTVYRTQKEFAGLKH